MAIAVEVAVFDPQEKARQLRAQAKDLQHRVTHAAARVIQAEYKPALVEQVLLHMPSGYAPVLAKSLSVHTMVNLVGRPGVTIRITAPTGGQGRDVRALERGLLRHPLFGNKERWFSQKVRRGQAHAALRKVRDRVVNAVDHELGRIVEELAA